MTLNTGTTYPFEGTGKLGPKDKAVLKYVMANVGRRLTSAQVAGAIGWTPEAVSHSFTRIRKSLIKGGFNNVSTETDSIYVQS